MFCCRYIWTLEKWQCEIVLLLTIVYEKKVVLDVRLTNAVENQQLETLKVRVDWLT